MATKQDFTADEWAKIRDSVMAASLAVTAADPSGLLGTIKEAIAGGSAMLAAKSDAGAGELIKAVVADFESADALKEMRQSVKERFRGAKASEISSRSVEALAEVGSLLDSKAPEDVAEFKAWLRGISQKVAEASSEGGFLGFGGVKVSDAEKATIDEVDKALRLSA